MVSFILGKEVRFANAAVREIILRELLVHPPAIPLDAAAVEARGLDRKRNEYNVSFLVLK